MKSLNDPSEESLRKLMSQRFQSYEKEPTAQLTHSVFETLRRMRKHRTTQILLTSLLLIGIGIVGSLLYVNKRKAFIGHIHPSSSKDQPLKKPYTALLHDRPSASSPGNKTTQAGSIYRLNPNEESKAMASLGTEKPGKMRVTPVSSSAGAPKRVAFSRDENDQPVLTTKPMEAEQPIAPIGILAGQPVSWYTSTLKMPEPAYAEAHIPANEPIEDQDWKLVAGIIPTNNFQTLRIIPKEGLIYQNFRFPKAGSVHSLGYKFQIGVERKGIQLLMNYSEFSHAVTYEVAGDEFILVPDASNNSKPVRKATTLHDKNSVRQIGIGLKKHLVFTKGALRTHYFDLGAEAAKQLGSGSNALWLNASFGKEIRMPGRTSLAIGPYAEYSLQKFKSPNQVYSSTPYQVGISIGLRLHK